jgi:hypothetical protein
MPYTADKPSMVPPSDELRTRIPGWGVDLDPADRPSVPRERFDPELSGAHWTLPEQQPENWPRERSIEHLRLTPVFGTSCPPKGASGALRKYAYRRFSEGRAAHWLLLLAADRVDVVESVARSFVSLRPDNPVTQSGAKAELTHNGVASRRGRNRADLSHQALDPVFNAAPWVVGSAAAYSLVRRMARRRTR